MKRKNLLALALSLLIMVGLFTGCAAKSFDSASSGFMNSAVVEEMRGDYLESPPIPGKAPGIATGTSVAQPQQKLIKTIDLTAETENLDALMAALSEKIASLGGYVENQELYNGSSYSSHRSRSLIMTIRIPENQLDAFVNHVTESTNIISQRSEVEDVTLTYVAVESRMNALLAEEERLLAFMDKAENLTELMEVEARLTDVRYELENVTSQLRVLENQVSYGTVRLDVSEVQKFTPVEKETFWQRVSGGFVSSLQNLWNGIVNLTVFLLANLPYLVVVAAVAGGTLLCIRLATKKKRSAPKDENKN